MPVHRQQMCAPHLAIERWISQAVRERMGRLRTGMSCDYIRPPSQLAHCTVGISSRVRLAKRSRHRLDALVLQDPVVLYFQHKRGHRAHLRDIRYIPRRNRTDIGVFEGPRQPVRHDRFVCSPAFCSA